MGLHTRQKAERVHVVWIPIHNPVILSEKPIPPHGASGSAEATHYGLYQLAYIP